MENRGTIRFARLLELHIVNKISKDFAGKPIDDATLHQMRDEIRNKVHGIFQKSKYNLSGISLNWLSNQLFKNITLGTSEGKKRIDELVVFNEYKLAELPYDDLQLLRNLFNQTIYGHELEEEYQRRSAS